MCVNRNVNHPKLVQWEKTWPSVGGDGERGPRREPGDAPSSSCQDVPGPSNPIPSCSTATATDFDPDKLSIEEVQTIATFLEKRLMEHAEERTTGDTQPVDGARLVTHVAHDDVAAASSSVSTVGSELALVSEISAWFGGPHAPAIVGDDGGQRRVLGAEDVAGASHYDDAAITARPMTTGLSVPSTAAMGDQATTRLLGPLVEFKAPELKRIEPTECQLNLLTHVEDLQAKIESNLDRDLQRLEGNLLLVLFSFPVVFSFRLFVFSLSPFR